MENQTERQEEKRNRDDSFIERKKDRKEEIESQYLIKREQKQKRKGYDGTPMKASLGWEGERKRTRKRVRKCQMIGEKGKWQPN